jgi:hypothetical protein
MLGPGLTLTVAECARAGFVALGCQLPRRLHEQLERA